MTMTMITKPRNTRSGKIDGKGNPIDMHVGARVRLRRTLLGMSQEKLGEAIGLTFQQVQKYERGANRIGASRLFDLSRVLDVPVSFFYDDMSPAVAAASPVSVSTGTVTTRPDDPTSPMQRRDVLEMTRAYVALPRPIADQVRKLVQTMTSTAVA